MKRANRDINQLATLCDSVGCGDRMAEAQLTAILLPYIVVHISKKVDGHRAADIAQETLIAVIVNLRAGLINNPMTIRQYALSIANRYLINHFKECKKWQQSDLSCEEITAEEMSSQAALELQRNRMILVQAIAALPQLRDRMVLTCLLNSQDKQSACQQLSMKPDDFDRIVCRAKTRLAKSVNRCV
ncbi:MAG: RNA polymerase sigma factor [Psychrobium sp.]